MSNLVADTFRLPLHDLLARANAVHRAHFPDATIQLSSLLSIKTGGCPENCAYCPQSAHYATGVQKEALLPLDVVSRRAAEAKAAGATRFCMGAAWREVKDGPQFDQVLDMVRAVRGQGLEVCCTLGMLTEAQAERLAEAGLYAYNHNIDTSRSYYAKIISTRTYDDRLKTIANVRRAGITVCTGGIIGMGESEQDRIEFLEQLYAFTPHPESVTVNALIATKGTPLAEAASATGLELARVIATARILMPKSMVRLSAGREGMSDEAQFLCFFAGANSIFLGERLLTSANPRVADDMGLLKKTGFAPMAVSPA